MLRAGAPPGSLAGDLVAGAYALDRPLEEAAGGKTRGWKLETSFQVAGEETEHLEKTGALEALAHRIRVDLTFQADERQSSVRGPISLALERKWRREGFSLEVDSAVESAGPSPVRTGLDQAVVTSAIGTNCFGEVTSRSATTSCIGASEAAGAMPEMITLLEGISVRYGPTSIAVEWQARDGSSVVVHRDFGADGSPAVLVQRKAKGQ